MLSFKRLFCPGSCEYTACTLCFLKVMHFLPTGYLAGIEHFSLTGSQDMRARRDSLVQFLHFRLRDPTQLDLAKATHQANRRVRTRTRAALTAHSSFHPFTAASLKNRPIKVQYNNTLFQTCQGYW